VQNAGLPVSKDELMKSVWRGSFVEESNLTQTIFMLRKALRVSPDDQRYIVTLPGRGYLFSVEVKCLAEDGGLASPSSFAP
jgi:eukaryotic-like serine/threonine-protein kinase